MTQNKIGNLYICPVINTMGPVTDSRHSDLLSSWNEVDDVLERIFSSEYRTEFPDSLGSPLKFSWFFVSWSGFKSNPVHRDFGYFNIYDHYKNKWGEAIHQFGDGIFWMYNHPAASGVGNEWGMDWQQNAQYLEILMRFIDQRNYFPSVVEVVTEGNDTSHFLENFFPYDLSNRNSAEVNWEAKNADGKPMWQVIDWRKAPTDWSIYSPSEESYQFSGRMKRKIGRLLDIKTIVYEFREYEIEKAFERCLQGQDVMLSAYEHDFRDRAQVIKQYFIEPVSRIAKKYPQVKWQYKNSLEAFNLASGVSTQDQNPIQFEACFDRDDNLVLQASSQIFGNIPFTFQSGSEYRFISPLRIGNCSWLFYKGSFDPKMELVVAANKANGVSSIQRLNLTQCKRR